MKSNKYNSTYHISVISPLKKNMFVLLKKLGSLVCAISQRLSFLKRVLIYFPCCVSFTSRTLLSVPSFSHSYCTLLPLVMYHISPDFPNPDLLVEKHLASQVLWVPTHMHESVDAPPNSSPSGVQAIQLAKKCFAWALLRQYNYTRVLLGYQRLI